MLGNVLTIKTYTLSKCVNVSEIVSCFEITIKGKLSPCQEEENVVTQLSAPVCVCLAMLKMCLFIQ